MFARGAVWSNVLFTGGNRLGERRAQKHGRKAGWKPAMAVIKPVSFFSADYEKTRLNWFCYELAFGIYDSVRERLGKRMTMFGIDENALAGFSIKHAREAKTQILERLAGRSDNIGPSREAVKAFFPSMSDDMVDDTVDATLDAWDTLLEICEFCPEACITRRDEPAPMFDRI